MDIGVANWGTHSIGIFLGYGNNSFTNQTTYPTVRYPQSIALGYLNNDAWLDIVVASSDSDNVGIFFGYGDGTFANQITYSTGVFSSPYCVTVVDLNNDNILDIVVASYGTNNVFALLGHFNGTFTGQILFDLPFEAHPFFIVAGDFNNDRKVDLAVGDHGSDSLSILLQTC